jgi:hypothetical protein
MTDPRWIIEDEGLWYGPTPSQGWLDLWEAGCQNDPEAAAYDALVRCVRDAGTFAEARELARTVAAFADPVKPGSPLGALLDLLTGEG